MEPSVLAWSVLGISVTGFLYLASWIRGLSTRMEDLATNDDIVKELKEIKSALIGDIDKKGIITMLHEHSAEIQAMKKICEKNHG